LNFLFNNIYILIYVFVKIWADLLNYFIYSYKQAIDAMESPA
ncbi:MAG: hypothetical protein US64_C0001G0073, partial [Candidatus Nomurabacteria bacterium GW2011_GWC1_37_9]